MTDEIGSGTLVGRQIAGYQLLALLGAGGMGEVYRARDTRLGRDVALKVLRRERADDPAQQARFRREAQAASALNHPNILAVYDVGEENGIAFIITELVDGTSLREIVERGPLPIKELLDVSTQIAEGLAAAHEADIVHRDLKPENVMVTRDGRAKILDFGLALMAVPTAPAAGEVPHVTRTEAVLIQGTVPYMSPEQARGAAGDFHSDQFSFGLVLYEMTTGTRAFQRETPVQTLSAIIADEAPPISGINARAPAQLHWLIERCLAKDPLQRYAATRDLAQDLRTLRDRPAETPTLRAAVPHVARRRSVGRILLAIAVTIVALGVGVDLWLRLQSTDLAPSRVFEVFPPKGGDFQRTSSFMEVSPDGRSLVFVASSTGGRNALWVRSLVDSTDPRPLKDTEGGFLPYWSPDSRSIAFGAVGGKEPLMTMTVDVVNGVVETLDNALGPGAWNTDDTIVGPKNDGAKNDGLFRISAKRGGGSATRVTTLDAARNETAHRSPDFLPDRRHFLYVAESLQPEYNGICYVGSLDPAEPTTPSPLPFSVDSQVVYVEPGYLLYMQADKLFAVRFDSVRLRTTGQPELIAEHIERTAARHHGNFSVSKSGSVLAYRSIAETQLTWFDRRGAPRETIASGGSYANPELSPDEKTVAVSRLDPTGRSDIFLIGGTRPGETQFTIDASNEPSDEGMPLWFANGSGLIFRSNRTPPPSQRVPGLYRKTLGDGGTGELVRAGVTPWGAPLGWTRDGSLLYQASNGRNRVDLFTMPLTGNQAPVPVLQTSFNEEQGRLSPNGHWIAFVSDKTTTQEVYVAPFPSGGVLQKISVSGGIEPRWTRDATELIYLALDRTLMSVALKANPTVEPGTPQLIFKTRMSTAADRASTRQQYAVTKDGQRFLINQPADGEPGSSITVVVNWTSRLKR